TFKTINDPQKDEKVLTFDIARLAEPEAALEASETAKTWLAGRGIDLRTAKQLHLGFVQSAKAVQPNHPWVNEGWILFPYLSSDGKTITGLKYRSVRGKKTDDGVSGFLFKTGMKTSLFNLPAVDSFDDLFLVEGEPNCAVMAQAGYAC